MQMQVTGCLGPKKRGIVGIINEIAHEMGIHMGVSKNRGKTPQNGWFIMENPIKMI